MKPEKDYEALISDEGIIIFIVAYKEGEPQVKPVLLYDGGENAVFYRQKDEVILLDYLNQEVVARLSGAAFVVMMETTKDGKDILRDYPVAVKSAKPCALTAGNPDA